MFSECLLCGGEVERVVTILRWYQDVGVRHAEPVRFKKYFPVLFFLFVTPFQGYVVFMLLFTQRFALGYTYSAPKGAFYNRHVFRKLPTCYAIQGRGDRKINTAVSLWAVRQNLDDERNTNFVLLHISSGRYLAGGRGRLSIGVKLSCMRHCHLGIYW